MLRVFSLLVSLSFLCLSWVSYCHASESEMLLRLLYQKGVITQEEFDEVMADLRAEKETASKEEKTLDERLGAMEQKTDNIVEEQKAMFGRIEKGFDGISERFKGVVENVTIRGGITAIAQGSWDNDENFPAQDEAIDGTYSTDLEIGTTLGEHGEAFILMEAGEGVGLNDEVVTFWGVNDDAFPVENNVKVTEAWYAHEWFNKKLFLTIGKVDLTNYFDASEVANDETSQFIASGFVNNIAIEFPDNTGGARTQIFFTDELDLSLGYQLGDSDWDDIFEDPFLIGEVALRPKLGEAELQGNYRVMAWVNRQRHTHWQRLSNRIRGGTITGDDISLTDIFEGGPGEDKLKTYGVAFSLDQQITEDVTVFGRFGKQKKEASLFDITWSTGFDVTGRLWGREEDVFGMAFGQAHTSKYYADTLKEFGRNIGIENPKTGEVDFRALEDNQERFFESYYSINVVDDALWVSPDVQHVTNAFGLDKNDSVWLFGIRMQVWF